jgi:hypothetical protein
VTELERALVSLGRELEYPPTPDLAAVVAERLRRSRRTRRPRRTLVLAFALFLLISGTVVAAVPAARDAVLDLFGLQGATVERREELPAGRELGELELGPRMTLDAARRELGFAPLVPAALGEPASVHVRPDPPGGELALLYRQGPDALITEFRGDLHPDYAGKIATEANTVERVRVDGRRGVWVAGAPHLFFYRDEAGRVKESTLRLAQNVLLLEHGRVLVRVEGRLGKATALRIARSLR